MRSFFLLLIVFLVSFVYSLAQTDSRIAISGNSKICIVVLQVEFLDTAKVGKVDVVSSDCGDESLTRQAVEAAHKIKFEPKIVDGKPVRITKKIEYTFSPSENWPHVPNDAKAEEILFKAITNLGGNRYLQVKNQVGRGKFSVIRENAIVSFQTFVDLIVFPDKERTEFKGGGSRTTQVNTGDTGWVYDGDQELIKVQNETQIANFKQGIRSSLDNLLRGYWKGEAEVTYVGKRAATLGKRNEVVKLTYKDGFVVEFEFASEDGLPQKAVYKRTNPDGEEIKEEDRYAQFIDTGGIKAPFIVDRFTDGKPSSRINYESVEFNKSIPDSVFAKPSNPKEAKKDLKF
jgi:outer membrane lipoprotein-sorting protein